MPSLSGELDGQTRLKDILPSGIDLDQDLGWTGQPGDNYFDLKERIVATQGYEVSQNNVMLTAGANHANFLAIATLVQPGDEVIVPRPSWPQFYYVAEGVGAKVKTLDLRWELGWRWNMDELNGAVTEKTKLICICNPNNPTGTKLHEKEIKAVSDIARTAGAKVLVDESFRWFEWDKELTSTWIKHYDQAIVTTSVSKMISGDGLRIGWMVSRNKELISACEPLRYYSMEHTNVLGTIVVWAALEPDKFHAILKQKWEDGWARRQLVEKWMKNNNHFEWVPPEAGFLSFPRYDLPFLSEDLCRLLLERYQVVLAPGIAYDKEYHLRMGFGRVPIDLVKKGLVRLTKFLQDYDDGKTSL